MARFLASGSVLMLVVVDGARHARSKKVDPNDSIQIVNGHDASECVWKWQVGFRSDNASTGLSWCGGSLIDPEWVLTAAHCVTGDDLPYVIAGDYSASKFSGNEQIVEAADVYRHPRYNSWNSRNDIALVRLAKPMVLNECVGTIPLSLRKPEHGTKCWITGWGTLESGGDQPDILQQAQVFTMDNTACWRNTSYDFTDTWHPSMLCAQGEATNGDVIDGCQGDSGGPLVCETSPGQWELQGATSWGMGCAEREYPGIWSSVAEAHMWIEQVMKNDTAYVPPELEHPSCPKGSFGTIGGLPDEDGDCSCFPTHFCSIDGGKTKGCPMAAKKKLNLLSYADLFFEYDCAECKCHRRWR